MIVFENEGILSPLSISTFGVSVKENNNPIGFFGTGLKYAIAVLLRTGHSISIVTGGDSLHFTLQPTVIRGKSFDIICMSTNKQPAIPLGFTTDLGKQWEVWMAYRELACNCMDEGGKVTRRILPLKFGPESTAICVAGEPFADVFDKREEFLLSSAPLFTLGDKCEVRKLQHPSTKLFYRNVLVSYLEKPSLFQYNILSKSRLTEDRTLADSWYVPYVIAKGIGASENRNFLRTVLLAPKVSFESSLNFLGVSGELSPTFLAVVEELCETHSAECNSTAKEAFTTLTKKAFAPQEFALTTVQTKMLERAMRFCTSLGFPIATSNYTVKFVENLGGNVIGQAIEATGTIYISHQVFNSGGTKALASVLIEEYLHLSRGWADLTRELQTFLFDKVVSLGEELQGEPL